MHCITISFVLTKVLLLEEKKVGEKIFSLYVLNLFFPIHTHHLVGYRYMIYAVSERIADLIMNYD